MAIFRFFKTAAAAILDFQFLQILTVGMLKMATLRPNAKFCRNRSNRSRDMAIFQFSNMAAAGVLDFKNKYLLSKICAPVFCPSLPYRSR